MDKNLISIIIPCFNSEKYLKETIESIFSQTYKNYEVILIDDGSTDNTVSIIKSYGDKVKAEFCTNNKGVSAARNLGTKLAKGRFIQYLDSDDILTSSSLENKLQALIKNNADVAYSNWQHLVEQDDGTFKLGTSATVPIEKINPNYELAILIYFWAPPAALMYTKNVVDKIGNFNETLLYTQDTRFLLEAASHNGKFIHVNNICAYYRVHKASLSRKNVAMFVRDDLTNIKQVHELWSKQNKITNEYKKAFQIAYNSLARKSFTSDKKTFEEAYFILKEIKPNHTSTALKLLFTASKIFGYNNVKKTVLLYREIKNKLSALKISHKN